METPTLKNERGVALVIALIMLIVLTFIGISSISSSVFEVRISGNERAGSSAFYAAEGGVGVGISQLPDLMAYSGTIGSDENYRSGKMIPGNPQPLISLGEMGRSGYDVMWEFRRFQVNATGQSFSAVKEIEVQVSMGPYPAGTQYNN
jgi:type II secretory pathway component PulK